jgi:hypothetical protein
MIVSVLAMVMHKNVAKAVKVDHIGSFHCLFFMFYAQKISYNNILLFRKRFHSIWKMASFIDLG